MTNLSEAPCLQPTVSPAEWQARVDLAAAYRLVALNGWDDLIFTHISVSFLGYWVVRKLYHCGYHHDVIRVERHEVLLCWITGFF